MTTDKLVHELPDMLDALQSALDALFRAAGEGFGARFWVHLVVGLCVLTLAGKFFARWVANAEVRWTPLFFALAVPLFGWVLGWAAADVWLVPAVDIVHPLVLKTACAFLMWAVFAYIVALWLDGVTRLHAAMAVLLSYVCFMGALFAADACAAALAHEAQSVEHAVQTQAREAGK